MKLYIGQTLAQSVLNGTRSIFTFNPISSTDWYTVSSFEAAHASVDVNANVDKTYGLSGQTVGLGPIEFNNLPEKAIGRFLFVKDQPIDAGSPFIISVFAASLGGIASVELSFDNGSPVVMTAPGAGGNTTNEYRYSYTPDVGAAHASRVMVRAKITPLDSSAVPRLIEESLIVANGAYQQRFVDSVSGNDTNDGLTSGTAFATLGKAIQDVRSGKGAGKLDQTDQLWEIVLVGGSYDWSIPAIGAQTSAVQHTWLTIRSNDPASKAVIKPVDATADRCNVRVQLTRWKDIHFDFTQYATTVQNKTAGGFKGDNSWLNNQVDNPESFLPYRIWLDSCVLDGPTKMDTNGSTNTTAVSSFTEISGTPDDWSQGWTLDVYGVLDPVIDADFNSSGTYTGDGANTLSVNPVTLRYTPANGGTVRIECATQADRDLIYNNKLKSRLLIPTDQTAGVDLSNQYFPFRLGDLMLPSGTLALERTNIDGRYSWLASIPTTSDTNITFDHRYFYDVEGLKGILFNDKSYVTDSTVRYFGDGILTAELCRDCTVSLVEGDVISYCQMVYGITATDCGVYGDGAHRDQYQSGDNNITAVEPLGSLEQSKCVKENIIICNVDYQNSIGQGPFVAGRANRTYGLVIANSNWSLADFTFALKTQIDNDRYLQHNHLLMLHNTIQPQLTWKIESSFTYGTDGGGDPWYDSSGNAVTSTGPRYSNCVLHGNLFYDFLGPTPRGGTVGNGTSDGCLQNITNANTHQNFYFFSDTNSFSNFYPLNVDAQIPSDYSTYSSNPSLFPLIVDTAGLTNATLAAAAAGTLSTAPALRYDINGTDRLSSGTYNPGSGDVLPISTL